MTMTTEKVYNYSTQWGTTEKVFIRIDKYMDGSLALMLVDANDGSPFGFVTTHLQGVTPKPNCAFVKTWGENMGIENFIIKNKIGTPTGNVERSGFVESPEYDFTPLIEEVSI